MSDSENTKGAQSATEDNDKLKISQLTERVRLPAEITVDHNIEKAIRVLKRKLIREGLFKELKSRRYYEKPCDRKKRKQKEAIKRTRKEEARLKRFAQGLM